MIYGERIRQAREYCGFTQQELAEKIGVNQSYIAHIENNRNSPNENEKVIISISQQTGFTPAFFFKKPTNNFLFGILAFRARNSLTSRELNKAFQCANVLFEYIEKLTEKFNVPQVNLPLTNENPTKSAIIARKNFGLSIDTPIRNLTLTIEKNGVIVLAIPMILSKIDAFSTWTNNSKPVIATSSGKPADRMRFSIAHELGHLIMHRDSAKQIVEMEAEANIFAAEFLLPEKAMKCEILTPITLTSIARLKPRWGVSIQALVRRARDLEIISDRQYRYFFEQISLRGWRINEPKNLDIPKEKPRLIQKMIQQSYIGSNIIELIARDLNLSEEKTVELLNEYFDKDRMPFIKYPLITKQLDIYKQN
jgi:Zn-dependent peptidase ImmA (M78 family)/DNA-binding XRE family transcriptional regulator